MNKDYKYINEMIDKGYIRDTIYQVYEDRHINQLNEIFKYFDEMYEAPISKLGIQESDKCFHFESCDRYDRDGRYELYGEIIYKYFPQTEYDKGYPYELQFLEFLPLLYVNLNRCYNEGDTIDGIIDGKEVEYDVIKSSCDILSDDSGEYVELELMDKIDKCLRYIVKYTVRYYSKCDRLVIEKKNIRGDLINGN